MSKPLEPRYPWQDAYFAVIFELDAGRQQERMRVRRRCDAETRSRACRRSGARCGTRQPSRILCQAGELQKTCRLATDVRGQFDPSQETPLSRLRFELHMLE